MGEHLWGEVDARTWRMAMAFGGGVGGTQQEMCGALSGGVMVIGLHLAPEGPGEAEAPMREAVARYREQFVREIGPSQCAALRDERYGSEEEGKEPCSVLVQRAVRVLLRVLDEVG